MKTLAHLSPTLARHSMSAACVAPTCSTRSTATRKRGLLSRLREVLIGTPPSVEKATAWITRHVGDTLDSYRQAFLREVEALRVRAVCRGNSEEISELNEALRRARTDEGFRSQMEAPQTGNANLGSVRIRYGRLVEQILHSLNVHFHRSPAPER